jgi:CsoR family transcriptional regulator, copper-sensing transcriptional repressor
MHTPLQYVKIPPMTTSQRAQTQAPGYSAAGTKDDVLKRLRRIEGQVRGIAGMVEDERYCIDVLQQISAAQAALDKVALALVDDHTRYCVLGAEPENQEEKRQELMTALTRLVGRR